jgi:hypothetical protein
MNTDELASRFNIYKMDHAQAVPRGPCRCIISSAECPTCPRPPSRQQLRGQFLAPALHQCRALEPQQ